VPVTLVRSDSRRWTGPNLLSARPGAVIDAALEGIAPESFVEAWRAEARRMLEAVGWGSEALHARIVRGGAILALTAPVDALYAATEVNEWAFDAAARRLAGGEAPSQEEDAARLAALIAAERNPALMALRDAAAARGVAFLSDDDDASVGLGTGALTWPARTLPGPGEVPWPEVHDVPVALVTGTNGKTTTVRMLAAIARAAGVRAGVTSTDGIVVNGHAVEAGDWSGPGGGRRVLRDRRVEAAILETARGGMLRRGLPVPRADAAVVTNVAEDHLGEFGVHDAAALADVKLIVARSIHATGALVLNAEEALLRERAAALPVPPAWFSAAGPGGAAGERLAAAPRAAWLEDGVIVVREEGASRWSVPVDAVPATFGGAARHNVANALAAVLAACALGWSRDAIAAGLAAFEPSAAGNPGRGNARTIGGVRVIVDFAHNPHGMAAMVDLALALPARRRHVVLGQAGDRDDAAIRTLVREAWRLGPARVVVKEMSTYLRGRAPGEVAALIEAELRALGAGAAAVAHASGEVEAAREALRGAAEGDLVLLLVHSDRGSVMDWLDRLEKSGWHAGTPLAASL